MVGRKGQWFHEFFCWIVAFLQLSLSAGDLDGKGQCATHKNWIFPERYVIVNNYTVAIKSHIISIAECF